MPASKVRWPAIDSGSVDRLWPPTWKPGQPGRRAGGFSSNGVEKRILPPGCRPVRNMNRNAALLSFPLNTSGPLSSVEHDNRLDCELVFAYRIAQCLVQVARASDSVFLKGDTHNGYSSCSCAGPPCGPAAHHFDVGDRSGYCVAGAGSLRPNGDPGDPGSGQQSCRRCSGSCGSRFDPALVVPRQFASEPELRNGDRLYQPLGGSHPGELDPFGQRLHRRDGGLRSPGWQSHRLRYPLYAGKHRSDHVSAGGCCARGRVQA